SDLLFKPDAALQAELQWRLSMPLTVILLAALAIPLSYSTPRQGQYGKLVIGILIYLMHGNLLNVAKKWVEHGDVSPWIGVWWTHVILLMIVLILFNIKFLKNEMHRLSNLFLSFFQSSRTSNLPKA
ncbi:MAG: LptF/LptG family permease, partial [Thiomargarita sp.]|nr:LptF/LptG family permease [Thiomargarita sp.]